MKKILKNVIFLSNKEIIKNKLFLLFLIDICKQFFC